MDIKKLMESERERYIAKAWLYRGKKCIIMCFHGHFNAYVETSLDVGYSDEKLAMLGASPDYKVNCHGGITFGAGTIDISPFEKEIKYFGVDYAHSGDKVEGLWEDGHDWKVNEVVKDTEDFADSLIEYEAKYPQYKSFVDEIENKKEEFK